MWRAWLEAADVERLAIFLDLSTFSLRALKLVMSAGPLLVNAGVWPSDCRTRWPQCERQQNRSECHGGFVGSGLFVERELEVRKPRWLGDSAPRAIAESFGIMVNYLYDHDSIEDNHEHFVRGDAIVRSHDVDTLLADTELRDCSA